MQLAVFLLAINLAAFWSFWLDKRAAIGGRRRVPERELLALAFFGGAAGAVIAQRLFRHKTRKQPFATILFLIAAGNAGVGAALLLPA